LRRRATRGNPRTMYQNLLFEKESNTWQPGDVKYVRVAW